MKFERLQKVALARYDALADTAAHFSINDVIASAEAEFRSLPVDDDMYHALAVTLVRAIDVKRSARASEVAGQLDLLTGEPAALDRVWKLGGGQRIRARFANRIDALAWIGIRGDNTGRVVDAFEHDKREVAELMVYMPDDRVLIETAVHLRIRAIGLIGETP